MRLRMRNSRYLHFLGQPQAPYLLIMTCVTFLSGLGLLMVLSASAVQSFEESGSTYSIFLKQLLFLGIALTLMGIGLRLHNSYWEKLGRLALPLGAIALLLPAVPGIGKQINGNTNWIGFGPFTIQPSEFAKLLMILWAGVQLRKHHERLERGVPSQGITLLAGIPFIFMGLVLVGRDLGTALIFALIFMALLFLSGIPYRQIATVLLLLLGGGLGMALAVPNRLHRFAAVGNPFAPSVYKLAGWQPAHALMGLASGGLFGVGLGASRQKWANLAEAHTDFIFSVIGEELGLLGTTVVIFLYATLLYAIFRTALQTKDLFEKYVVSGIGCWLLVQIFINLATDVGIFPVVGVTLPFLSYGGSSLIANFLGIAFVLKVARRHMASVDGESR